MFIIDDGCDYDALTCNEYCVFCVLRNPAKPNELINEGIVVHTETKNLAVLAARAFAQKNHLDWLMFWGVHDEAGNKLEIDRELLKLKLSVFNLPPRLYSMPGITMYPLYVYVKNNETNETEVSCCEMPVSASSSRAQQREQAIDYAKNIFIKPLGFTWLGEVK